MSPRPKAFTLIELLVVISIISLLVAILLPALRGARVSSQRVSSLSNARQMTLALNAYATDNKSTMPVADTFENSSGSWELQSTGTYWSTRLHKQGYVNTWDVFWSPGKDTSNWKSSSSASFVDVDHPSDSWRRYRQVGYGINPAVSPDGATHGVGATQPTIEPLRLGESQAPPPSNMIMLVEVVLRGNWTTNPEYLAGMYKVSPSKNGNGFAPFNYDGTVTSSYVDGRAVAIKHTSGNHVTEKTSQVSASVVGASYDNLGWDPAYDPAFPTGPYAGAWHLRNSNTYRQQTPWYLTWRTTGWNKGLE